MGNTFLSTKYDKVKKYWRIITSPKLMPDRYPELLHPVNGNDRISIVFNI